MSRRIVGVTVGTPLPKPNWEQNNPQKGDYIKNKPKALNGEDGKDGITPHIGANGNWFIGDTDTGMPSRGADAPQDAVLYTTQALTHEQQAQARQNIGAIEAPETADVGQTIVVKEVDENGNPTVWGAADFTSGGIDGYTLIKSITLEEDCTKVNITTDDSGNAISIYEAIITVDNPQGGATTDDFSLFFDENGNSNVGHTLKFRLAGNTSSDMLLMYELERVGGLLRLKGCSRLKTTTGGVALQTLPILFNLGRITRINLGGDSRTAFLAGAEIKIYARG